jgi:molybdopterin-guanine dinucleotide biosynthesis protein A
MFRGFARRFLPNRLDWELKRAKKRGASSVLIGWNRGLGDLPLGLFAMVKRIQEELPLAKITFLTRDGLQKGFELLEGVEALVEPTWERGVPYQIPSDLAKKYDLVLKWPRPTDWVRSQIGKVVPKLLWKKEWDKLSDDFPPGYNYIAVQTKVESGYAEWRNWKKESYQELFDRLEEKSDIRVLLIGAEKGEPFQGKHLIDLRGQTTLFHVLSILKNRCSKALLPDSGILSLVYYLDVPFVLRCVSLWSDAAQGILKQNVPSPNPLLDHRPLVGEKRDAAKIEVDAVWKALFEEEKGREIEVRKRPRVALAILAGGQATRLGLGGPKGCVEVEGKALFHHILDQVKEQMQVYVMTSPLNDEATRNFLKDRAVSFVQQGVLPFVDEAGKELAQFGPDGNGAIFRLLKDLEGVDAVQIVPVDNRLVKPGDPLLLSHLERADVVLQVVKRVPGEAMGKVVRRRNRVEIVEYTEIGEDEGGYSYTGVMVVSLPFLKEVADLKLPWHWVKKQGVWKREQFIFDVLPYAKSVAVVEVERATSYAPVKTISDILKG